MIAKRVAAAAIVCAAATGMAQAPRPCSGPEYRQFDFWVGTWDVFSPDGKLAGHSRVEPIEGGCGIQENWTGAGGGTGRSLNTYSPLDRKWHQFWIGAGGVVLNLAGTFDHTTLTMTGRSAAPAGGAVENRLSFTPNPDGTVRQHWETSSDGKTWTTAFEGRYSRTRASSDTPQGITYRAPSGLTLRLILDENNLGSEVSLGEMTFPPNLDSGDHTHGAIEMFYVTSGELEHVVNGKSEVLKPGMAGFVKPPDKVRHKTGAAGAKAVVVWVPGT
ncbi:MAG TPA: cupin domain-containing protein, partial [Rhodanobacteraceae bacterium]